MNDWRYLPLRALFAIVSYMPFWVLYGIADLLFLFIYYIIRYRHKIVKQNINESFPKMTNKERIVIIRQFYHNFTDYIVETIKLNHISDNQMRQRMIFKNVEIVDTLLEKGKSIAIYFSHCGNWEWGPSMKLWSHLQSNDDIVYSQVYRPLRNKWFDAYMLHLRGRFKTQSFQKHTVFRDLVRVRHNNMLSITGFMSDQKPSIGDMSHVVMFLNHPTAIITGTEQIARKLDMAVVYWDISKYRRGHYSITIRLITDDISSMPKMAVTDCYAHMLEETINRNPSIWLWTHNRWKNKVEFPKTEQNDNQQ